MQFLHLFIVGIQFLAAIVLILVIAVQTTKSEQSGSGMGWGTIGGQATSSVTKFGFDAQVGRVTTWIAISYVVLSFVGAYLEAHLRTMQL